MNAKSESPVSSLAGSSIGVSWALLHLTPLLLVPILTHTIQTVIGIDGAAAVSHLVIIIWISVGQGYLLRTVLTRPRHWAWRTGVGLAMAVVVGLVVMSTVDLGGYDTLATLFGMLAAGLVLGLIQSRAQPLSALRWVMASVIGWLIAVVVFRSAIMAMAGLSIGGFMPFGLAYNSGHNELLWSAVGLAGYGAATAWNVAMLARSLSALVPDSSLSRT